MSNGERTIIAGGLLGGLLVGGLLLRGIASADRTAPLPHIAPKTLTPPAASSTGDDEVESLKQRIAALERKQLERRLAELEAETAATDEEESLPRLRKQTAPSTHATVIAESAPGRRTAPRSTSESLVTQDATSHRKSIVESEKVKKSVGKNSPSGQATLDYWNALNDIIARETAMRAPPASVTAGNAGEFVQARLSAGKFASGAIHDLDTNGVDPEAIALGRDLTAWYQEEVTLNTRAQSLLGSSSIAERRGSAGNTWRSGEEQHRKNCDDINRRGAELQSRLSGKYRLTFPPLN